MLLTQTQPSPSSLHPKCWVYLEFQSNFSYFYKASKLLCLFLILKVISDNDFFKCKLLKELINIRIFQRQNHMNTPTPELIIVC